MSCNVHVNPRIKCAQQLLKNCGLGAYWKPIMGILFIQWLILLGYGVDNTHSYYDCLDSHGEDSSSPQSICGGLLPNLCSKKIRKNAYMYRGHIRFSCL